MANWMNFGKNLISAQFKAICFIRYLLYRVVTTNFPPLFYIAAAQKETLKNSLERSDLIYHNFSS